MLFLINCIIMFPDKFEYYAPKSIEEAAEFLNDLLDAINQFEIK